MRKKLWWVPPVLGMILFAVILIAFTVSLSGCYTERTAQKHVDKAHHRFPTVGAKYCLDRFPLITGTNDSTWTVPGVEPEQDNEVQVDCYAILESLLPDISNELRKQISDSMKTLLRPVVPCPPCKPRVDTVYRFREITKEDSRKLLLKQAELDKAKVMIDGLKADKIKLTDSRDDWRKLAIGALALIALYVVFRAVRYYLLRK